MRWGIKDGRLTELLKAPLFINSFYLMFNSALVAGLGFLFVVAIGRMFTSAQVGLYSAAISGSALIVILSRLGFEIGIIRHISESKSPSKMINTCLSISACLSLILSMVFLAGAGLWSTDMVRVRSDTLTSVLFIAFTVLSTLISLQASIFVGSRKTRCLLFRDASGNLVKLGSIALMVGLGVAGMLLSSVLGAICAILVGILLSTKALNGYRFRPSLDIGYIKPVFRYSLWNYVSSITGTGVTMAIPLVMIGLSTAQDTSYYYMAMTLITIASVIPDSIFTSLLAEGSHFPSEIENLSRRALKLTFIVVVPIVITILFLGPYALLIFGPEYAVNSSPVLSILSISLLFSTITTAAYNVKLVRKEMQAAVAIVASTGLLTILLTATLVPIIGLEGTGWARLIAYGLVAVLVSILWFRHKI